MSEDQMLGPNARLALIGCVAMAVAAVGYLGYDIFFSDKLPDPVALEATLAEMVADGDSVASTTRMLVSDGFDCGLVSGETTGTWHCDLAERAPESEFDCPRRIMVSLVPGQNKALASFSVIDAETCM